MTSEQSIPDRTTIDRRTLLAGTGGLLLAALGFAACGGGISVLPVGRSRATINFSANSDGSGGSWSATAGALSGSGSFTRDGDGAVSSVSGNFGGTSLSLEVDAYQGGISGTFGSENVSGSWNGGGGNATIGSRSVDVNVEGGGETSYDADYNVTNT